MPSFVNLSVKLSAHKQNGFAIFLSDQDITMLRFKEVLFCFDSWGKPMLLLF